ncbi:MAG: cobalamin-dependent protein [Candidatus Tectomicrobia bacterium]|nr:cobalamin-dependent protein [Candidatus Tectomicrobia bacterium]
MEPDQGHPIKVVVLRTGLSPHVIRVWEKRYGAVEPMRTPTNRRRYTDADIERLLLLQRATRIGRSIGQIAHLPTETLRNLVREDEEASLPSAPQPVSRSEPLPTQSYLDGCLDAVQQLDSFALEVVLMRARVALSQPAFIEQLIVPLMESIGDLFHDGSLRIMHEHMASAVVRSFLWSLKSSAEQSTYAPILIVATPVGQWHEIGALMVASTASAEGWDITYLGANLPAQEIAAAVQQQSAKVVALSLVYPADDPRIRQELVALRRYVGPEVKLLIGGSGSAGYQDVLEDIDAVCLDDIAQLRPHLSTLRQQPRS